MSDCKPYKSDVSEERWALIEPVISAWKADHPSPTRHQGRYEMREIVNAILYQGRTGCQWDYLPHDLPPKSAVYYYFAAWRDDGTDVKINNLLRWQVGDPLDQGVRQVECGRIWNQRGSCADELRRRTPLSTAREPRALRTQARHPISGHSERAH